MFSVCIYNDSSVLVGGNYTIGIQRFDFNETHFWKHSQVYTLSEDYVIGITLHPHNKSEGFISHHLEKRFYHITFNGTHVIKPSNNYNNNFQLQTTSTSRDIQFNSQGNRFLASHHDGTIYLLSLCQI